MEVKVSVRTLVEFILRSGDIDNRIGTFAENAMLEGGRIHRMIQRRMGADYSAEVPLSFVWHGKECDICVEGRADGVIENESGVTIDEIKSTYADVMKYKAAYPLHLAQAKFYAYITATKKALENIKVRITYCNIDTEEIRYFNEDCPYIELEKFVEDVMNAYEKWAVFSEKWKVLRNESIVGLPFPFEYRKGQDELVRHVYHTICHKKKLFLEAPTGVGKTISTLYPSVCAMGQQLSSKIFYLTAKTITGTVADTTLNIMRDNGLKIKSIALTAKEKICKTKETQCNPDACPYAKGHFDRVNDCIYDMITNCDSFSREVISEYAEKYTVCPFEMGLDASLFADVIIGDYNYAFDPRAKLKRYFAEEKKGDYIFLVDEAHNLVDRAREMYSAAMVKEDFLALKHTCAAYPKLAKRLERCNKALLDIKRDCGNYIIEPETTPFVNALLALYSYLEKQLQTKPENDKHHPNPNDDLPLTGSVKEAVLDFYFEIAHFLTIYELVDENYTVFSAYDESGNFYLKLFCVNPRKNLMECMEAARSSVLFSATLLPIQYYKNLLAGKEDDYEVYAQTVFNSNRLGLFVGSDVTSKYTRRSADEYQNIASYIYKVANSRYGNYMVFFPSYGFMDKVLSAYKRLYSDDENVEIIVQSSGMKEEEREAFLARFRGNEEIDLSDFDGMLTVEEEETSLIGFCVMGGIFSEGIDLKDEGLIGAMIVGTGLPLVCLERDIIKDYFEESGQNGFDYAYRFPGMNKVLQSAGRVIRTETDFGIVVLMDERFLNNSYRKLFPREWEDIQNVNLSDVSQKIDKFWDEWL